MKAKYTVVNEADCLVMVEDVLGSGFAEIDPQSFSGLHTEEIEAMSGRYFTPEKAAEDFELELLDKGPDGRVYKMNDTYIVQRMGKDDGTNVVKTLEVKESDIHELLLPADSKYMKNAIRYEKVKDKLGEDSAKVYQAMAKIEGLNVNYQNMSLKNIHEALDGQFSTGVVYTAARSLLEYQGTKKQARAKWVKNHKKRYKDRPKDCVKGLYSFMDGKVPSYADVQKMQNSAKTIPEKKYTDDSNREKTGIVLPNIDYSQFMAKA